MPSGSESRAGPLAAVGRGLLWPVRRILDPRFRGLAEQADHQHADLAHRLEVLTESVQRLEKIPHEVRTTIEEKFDDMQDALGDVARAQLDAAREADELIGRSIGALLAETSMIADRFAGEPEVEPLYAYRALARVPAPARILGLGASNALAHPLTALGYEIACVDELPRETEERFDAALLLSGFAGAVDGQTVARIGELTTPGGTLVLSVLGSDDRSQVERLLDGWRIEDFTVAADGAQRRLVLVTAARHGD